MDQPSGKGGGEGEKYLDTQVSIYKDIMDAMNIHV